MGRRFCWCDETSWDDYRANALRWHAVRDALRHRSAPRCRLKIGRGASRAALPRRAWER
ncbi:DUF1534 domain-containing protein [Pseudomonas savastanoi]|nr:DUF1534 domain-containing protein [Pseudomonas amygdali pv. tabaci str. ATCC 11528]QOI02862.1 DUF1534 domain-containing protein [Pseudomonas savastanoi]